jgi:hypothetical protein
MFLPEAIRPAERSVAIEVFKGRFILRTAENTGVRPHLFAAVRTELKRLLEAKLDLFRDLPPVRHVLFTPL